ncbi:DUF2726 domain-containing protein [Rhodobacteraceae bacterium 2376]|uniref:DUF2726 domain-containing protein n=1 Tax=Rhabdonatronobacter sediminivivens TaxID=2743469 RepID=A0A7Z0HWL3_9RHOB|nr:DUF2726 domain-containing protein [Rhabdonatronobacter sediminivivens]NYS23679.1 DUF2726 domain-containing protein [Rhabdonatronobacter sediminivivens]
MGDLADVAGPLAPLVLALLVLVALLVLYHRFTTPRFEARPLLNKAEQRVFAMLSRSVPRQFGKSARLFAQVSYGEFLSCKDKRAFWTINARRADFLITDAGFHPLCVIEYQGSGHYGYSRKSAKRAAHGDRMKRRALASAGVELVELAPKATPAQVDALLADAAARCGAMEGDGVTALRG